MVETDTFQINSEKDYTIPGYSTIFHDKAKPNDKTRMVCLIKEEKLIKSNIKIRKDLMDKNFPSIWLEIKQNHRKNLLICGFYREWSKDGLLNSEEQLSAIKILTSQIEKSDAESKNIVILGDMNLCASKWNDHDFNLKF